MSDTTSTAPTAPKRNGAVFLTMLDGLVTAAHDVGAINENALADVLRELLAGKALSLDALATIFGVNTIHALTASPVRSAREDLFRAAALQGLCALPASDGGGFITAHITQRAEQIVRQLQEEGVL